MIICNNCGTVEKDQYEFTIQELKALYKLIEHEYIPYENEEGHAVINKIMKILKENDNLAK